MPETFGKPLNCIVNPRILDMKMQKILFAVCCREQDRFIRRGGGLFFEGIHHTLPDEFTDRVFLPPFDLFLCRFQCGDVE